MIRNAAPSDFNELKLLAIAAHKGSMYSETEIDFNHLKLTYDYLCDDSNAFCKVAVIDGDLTGVIGGIAAKNSWGIMVATDLIMYAKKGTPELIRSFTDWGMQHDCTYIMLELITENDRYESLAKALGFNRAGTTMAKEV